MIILGADTSCDRASCALWIDGKIEERKTAEDKRRHSETFMPMVAGLMKGKGVKPADLDFLAVSTGPGSFTGLRIGMASIKGMAYTLGLKIACATSLDILADGLSDAEGIICPVIDARNRQVYTALYENSSGGVIRTTDYMGIKVEDLAKKLLDGQKPVKLCGDAANEYCGYFAEKFHIPCEVPEDSGYPSAGVLVNMAAKGHPGISVLDAEEALPFYLRKSQAERLHGKK
jgi:tRNA threonylcarbamoyladenosine biosynthesis protein TsaB